MKSRILVIITIMAVVAVTTAIAGQNKSDFRAISQRSSACELNKGCGMKDKEKSCDKEKKKDCDKEKKKECEKDKQKECPKDPNSES